MKYCTKFFSSWGMSQVKSGWLSVYMPAQMSDDDIKAIVAAAIEETGASGMAAMGKVMGIVKAKCAGKADMGRVSALVKAALSA